MSDAPPTGESPVPAPSAAAEPGAVVPPPGTTPPPPPGTTAPPPIGAGPAAEPRTASGLPNPHGLPEIAVERPEVAVAGAFAGGLVLAMILKRLGR